MRANFILKYISAINSKCLCHWDIKGRRRHDGKRYIETVNNGLVFPSVKVVERRNDVPPAAAQSVEVKCFEANQPLRKAKGSNANISSAMIIIIINTKQNSLPSENILLVVQVCFLQRA